ncbi:plastocyanin [Natrinema sp. SYSU A 869]|uniref:plastocyanin n=1 Tax=Natrinema sp. SYSU A 869 TaxID=2871694 RepID=UPI001CA3C2A3|nr:plastocyanin [Natrinema sp. SYSU A 869]
MDDFDALLEAHRESMATTSFTGEYDYRVFLTVEEIEEVKRELSIEKSFDIQAEPVDERAARTSYGFGSEPGQKRSIYIDGDDRATNYLDPITHESSGDLIDESLERIDGWMLEPIADYRGTKTTEAGPVHEYRLSGIDSEMIPRAFPGAETDGDGHILIDETGRIRQYQTTQSGESDGITMEIELEFKFDQFGETTVEEPAGVKEVGPGGYQVIEPGTRIELGAQRNGWTGIELSLIADLDNPILALEAGEPYEIGWTAGNGGVHNLEIVNADDSVVDELATEQTYDREEEKWLKFTASEEMVAYRCESDEEIATGTIVVR